MLSWDDELSISSKLAKRYEVRRRCAEDLQVNKLKVTRDMLSTSEDKCAWDDGFSAAHRLVEAYIPFIYKTATEVVQQYNLSSSSTPNWSDLVHEGIMAAYTCTWAFNLNGVAADHPGRRFNTYSKPHIKKNMRRLVMKEKTPFKIDVETIQTTWASRNISETLKEKLGRQPTPDEVREALYFKPGKNERDLPMRGSVIDVDDHENGGANMVPQSASFVAEQDVVQSVIRLWTALCIACGYGVANDALVFFGFDRGYPRDDKECAEVWGVSTYFSRRRIAEVKTVLVHPATRGRLRQLLQQQGGVHVG